MTRELSLDELWQSAPSGGHAMRSGRGFPEPVRRYLEHAIAPGTPLASAARVRMHGEIKLGGWLPFTAEQVLSREHGMIWSANVSMHGVPVRGSDRLLDGEGSMRWKLFGMIPVMTASGPDITRSAAGRVGGESVWLPSLLYGDDVSWTALDSTHLHASFAVQGEGVELALAIDETGRLKTVELPRWGNPEGAAFHYVDFGVIVEEEGTFGGYTVPTRLRAGWHFAGGHFEQDGEFFRATVEDVSYR